MIRAAPVLCPCLPPDSLCECRPIDQLHHQGTNAAGFFQAIKGGDVGMVQRRQYVGFTLERDMRSETSAEGRRLDRYRG
jgi:hypothetical protein